MQMEWLQQPVASALFNGNHGESQERGGEPRSMPSSRDWLSPHYFSAHPSSPGICRVCLFWSCSPFLIRKLPSLSRIRAIIPGRPASACLTNRRCSASLKRSFCRSLLNWYTINGFMLSLLSSGATLDCDDYDYRLSADTIQRQRGGGHHSNEWDKNGPILDGLVRQRTIEYHERGGQMSTRW